MYVVSQKNWTTPVKSLKQKCANVNVENLQIKQVNQLSTGNDATHNYNHITLGKRRRGMKGKMANKKKVRSLRRISKFRNPRKYGTFLRD